MIDFINHNNKSVPVLHAQGDSKLDYRDMFFWMHDKPCSVPDWVGVITCCNSIMLDRADLLAQLQKNEIPYLNPAAKVVRWQNGMKPQLIVKAIKSMYEQITHILCMDSLDVMLNGDFARAFAGYQQYGKPVLFGASRNNYPNHIIDKVRDRDWRGNFRYLNAGTSFGERDAMLKFYLKVCELPQQEQEQVSVRTVFGDNQDWVDFDWRCEMFQTFGNANVEYRDDETIKVF